MCEQIYRHDVRERDDQPKKAWSPGEPTAPPIRHTWREVHQRARRLSGGLASSGVRPGDAVAVLAGAPVEIAPPVAQAIWMRGASLTMLHQQLPPAPTCSGGQRKPLPSSA